MMNYPYTPGIPLSRERLDVMRIRFALEWPLAEIARLIHAVGGRIVNDGRGGLVVVKGGKSMNAYNHDEECAPVVDDHAPILSICASCGWAIEEGYLLCLECEAELDRETADHGRFGVGA